MMKSVFFILAILVVEASADSYCTYYSGLRTYHEWCDWGCCYTYTYGSPCCEDPVYVGKPFIIGISIGSVVFVIAVIAGVVYRRRRYATTTTTVQYGAPPANPHVFSTSASTNNYAGYGHNYSNQSNTNVVY